MGWINNLYFINFWVIEGGITFIYRAALARVNQVSVKTLYTWRKKYCSDSSEKSTDIQANEKFVEVKVPEEIKAGSGMKLKKVVLEFDEFSIAIEGKLNHKYLNQILEILR